MIKILKNVAVQITCQNLRPFLSIYHKICVFIQDFFVLKCAYSLAVFHQEYMWKQSPSPFLSISHMPISCAYIYQYHTR